jgi:hypothetical protein
MKIEDFIQSYIPNDNILGYDIDNFNQDIYNLKEFRDLELSDQPLILEKGKLLPNQKIIQRFMSSFTPYEGILLYHEVGVGKTCSSVGVAEQIREHGKDFKRCLVLLKGRTLMDNYINELVFVCTDGKYIPENYENLTSMEKTIRVKKMINDFYEFNTFEVFSKKIEKMDNKQIQILYNNSIVIVDEIHNIKGISDEYKSIHRFLHTINQSKTILMSATPMTDQVNEISDIMNLLLPLNDQLPTGDNFEEQYLDSSKKVKEDKIRELARYFTGRVSYLKAPKSDISRIYEGEHLGTLKYFNVYEDKMLKFQNDSYNEAYKKDKNDKIKTGIYSNARQASLTVYPDGTYGQSGFIKYIRIEKRLVPGEVDKFIYSYSLTKEFKEYLGTSIEEKLKNLKKISTKYYTVISHILKNRNKLQFIYSDLVEGSGLIIFSKILELFGYNNSKGNEGKESTKYSIFTNKTITTKQIKNVLETFNSNKNKYGEYIHVIMGSSLIAEGLSFKNVQDVHILTPHWNYSETEQAIGRAIRSFSHIALKNDGLNVLVRIYHHVTIGDEKSEQSIDLLMYEYSERKDISIKSMGRVIERLAFDCQLTKKRNEEKNEYDNTRVCEYQSCDYDCYGINYITEDVITSNYNEYYLSKDYKNYEERIKEYFSQTNYGILSDLQEYFDDVPETTLIASLDIFIKKRIPILTNTGFIGYLSEEFNKYYLTDNIHVYSQKFTDNYYLDEPTLVKKQEFNILLNDLQFSILPSKIDKLLENTDNKLIFNSILRSFPDIVKEDFLEKSVLAKSKNISKNISFRNNILEYFSPFITKKGNIIYSTLIKPTRCFNGNEWYDCTEKETTKLTEEQKDIEKDLEDNEYGYYGIIDTKKDKFLIRDVSRKELIEIQDKRKKSTGKACSSWERPDLVKVADKLKLYVPEKELNKESVKDLIKLTEKTKYKNAALAFTNDEMNDMSIENLRRIIYYATIKKDEFCKILQKWFKDNKLLLIK